MKKTVVTTMLITTCLASLDSAVADVNSFFNQYTMIDTASKKDNFKRNVLNVFNVECVETLKDIESILYAMTKDFTLDTVKNYDSSALLKSIEGLESSAFRLINDKIVTKAEVKDFLQLLLPVKNKIVRFQQVQKSLNVVPTYYKSDINSSFIKELADNTTNKLHSKIRSRA